MTASATSRGLIAHARPPRVARRRRALAQPDVPVPERRLGLRRRRLPRRPSRARHARRPRRAARRGRGARHPGAARPRPEPHLGPAPVVRDARGARARTATGTSGPTRRRTAARPTTGGQLFGGSAWDVDEPTGQYYLHNFLPAQPDLDWWNDERARRVRRHPAVLVRPRRRRLPHRRRARPRQGPRAARQPAGRRRTRLATRSAWASGSTTAQPAGGARRLPALARLARRVRPEPAAARRDVRAWSSSGWRASTATAATSCTWRSTSRSCIADLDADVLRESSSATEAALPDGAWPVWTSSNHDVERFPTRWARRRRRAARACALLMLLTLRGTPVLYYGDELGCPTSRCPTTRSRPGRPARSAPSTAATARGRRCRGSRGGRRVHDAGVEPWLPFGDRDALTVAEQRADRGSTLCPRARPDRAPALARGPRARRLRDDPVPAGDLGLAARRAATGVALNLGDGPASIELTGTVLVGTRRERDGEHVDGTLTLEPGEGVVLELEPRRASRSGRASRPRSPARARAARAGARRAPRRG